MSYRLRLGVKVNGKLGSGGIGFERMLVQIESSGERVAVNEMVIKGIPIDAMAGDRIVVNGTAIWNPGS